MESKVHLDFHVSLLKRKVGDPTNTTPTMPPFSEEGGPMIQSLKILKYRWVKNGEKFVSKALVQWQHLSPEDATWEEIDQLQQQFPQLNLEDKVPLQGEVIDGDPRKNPRRTAHQARPQYLALVVESTKEAHGHVEEVENTKEAQGHVDDLVG
jgi:hypothetical protein